MSSQSNQPIQTHTEIRYCILHDNSKYIAYQGTLYNTKEDAQKMAHHYAKHYGIEMKVATVTFEVEDW